ncbi:hypothetical protein FQR65_LT18793 [Abscondita terminalis]|nr:hypothetical protein FQR65_LT18793 [Abscondita terminalis]
MARSFFGKLEKPKIDDIKGLAPSIAIQQKVISSNPRSTVGTTTEIYDYLKLLFARVGHTYSPVSGEEKKAPTLILRAPWHYEAENFAEQLKTLKLQGFTRLEIGGMLASIEDLESLGICNLKQELRYSWLSTAF